MIDGVAKFADVSGPRSGAEFCKKIIGDSGGLECRAGVVDELFCKEREIIESISERWQANREGAQAVEQIFTKAAGCDHFGEIAVCGGEEAGSGGPFFTAANGAEASGFEYSQKFDLDIEGRIGDFIEEQRTTGGGIEEPWPGFLSTGEGAANMTKEFALDQGGIERSWADGNEWAVRNAAVLVNSAGCEFFSGAGFAEKQDWVGGWGDECQLAIEGLHGGAAASDFGIAGFENWQRFAGFLLKCTVDYCSEGVQVKGLDEVFEGTFSEGAGCGGKVSESRHDDDGQVGVFVFPCGEGGKAVDAWQANVDSNQVGLK
jgi:hypothetical protein